MSNYAEFSISGLISFHSDNEYNFLTYIDDQDANNELNGFYYRDEFVIPKSKFETIDSELHYNHNLTNNNIFIEQKFREKVEDFLNDGRYKLFKSPTEGNFIVGLMNNQLTPNDTLGRMIYSFSSQAYEIADNSYVNLVKYEIQQFSEFNPVIEKQNTLIGQISGIIWDYTKGIQWNKDKTKIDNIDTSQIGSVDIIELIKTQISNIDIKEGSVGQYQYNFHRLNSIWIEPYPDISIKQDIKNDYAEIAQLQLAIAQTEDQQTLIQLKEQLEAVKDKLQKDQVLDYYMDDHYPANPLIELQINNQPIRLGYGKIYHIDNLFNLFENGLTITYKPDIYYPFILNFSCSTYLEEKPQLAVERDMQYKLWDQVYGIFTTDKTKYNMYLYNLNRYNEGEISSKPPIPYHYTHDIYETIKLDQQEQISNLLGNQVTFLEYEIEGYIWSTDYKYRLLNLGLYGLEFEAEPGTKLSIKYSNNTTYNIVINPTGKHVIKYTDELLNNIKAIEVSTDTYCVVNYVSWIRIQEMQQGSNTLPSSNETQEELS